jgi:ATP-dependent protease ClpP protease subunit
MTGKITIQNRSKRLAEIHIEGTIGVPEKMQFDDPNRRVSTYETFGEQLRAIGAIRAETVLVHIRSTGGSVSDALLIYEALGELDARIVTRCYGYVASAATIIAQAASRGHREISKNALYLIHRASSNAEGNAGELNRTADLLDKTDERIAGIYADASGKAAGHFIALMQENDGNGRWLTAEEALGEGLADRIVPAGKIRNAIRGLLGLGAKNPPENPKLHNETAQANPVVEAKQAVPAQNAADALEEEIARYENPAEPAPEQEIADLQNRIVELEALNAKLRAKATQTLPKEDPSTREIKREGNATAYENDLQNFRNL